MTTKDERTIAGVVLGSTARMILGRYAHHAIAPPVRLLNGTGITFGVFWLTILFIHQQKGMNNRQCLMHAWRGRHSADATSTP